VTTPTIGTALHAVTITAWMGEITAAVRAERDQLTQLDAAIGDGDHGINMNRGFDAVSKALVVQDNGIPPGRLLIIVGKTLVSTVGGASGPLWGTAFRRAGRALGDAPDFDGPALLGALDAAIAGIVELGAAAPEDKTMIDALTPAVAALRNALDAGQPVDVALAGAARAAEEGARATIPMRARKGRASYLGERSIGHQDPGATSAALVIRALERAVSQAG
jgi:dihydroxyacetone kinase-like protein